MRVFVSFPAGAQVLNNYNLKKLGRFGPLKKMDFQKVIWVRGEGGTVFFV